MSNKETGYLIPGQVAQANCVKVLINGKLHAVVKDHPSAYTLVDALMLLLGSNYSRSEFRAEPAFIEGIGW